MRGLAFALLLAGCSSDAEDALDMLEGVKARACKCEGASCAADAEAGLARWQERHGKVDGTAAQAAKAQALIKETRKCVTPR